MNIPWYLPVMIALLLRDGFFSILVKKAVVSAGRMERFVLQFLFAWIYAILFFMFSGGTFSTLDWQVAFVFGIGVINGLATYFYWKAVDINLGKSSLFLFLDDVIAVSLCLIILNEFVFLNNGLVLGLILSFSSLISFTIHAYHRRNDQGSVNMNLFVYVFIHSIMRGFILFLMKYSTVQDIPTYKFLVGWYGGATLASIFLFVLISRNINFFGICSKNHFPIMPVMSASMIISLGLVYWSYQLAPLTVVQPIFFTSQMIIPTLIGLYYFNERKNIDNKEKLFFFIGIFGSLLIGINYSTR